jgi:alpha/beta superfamily hydrolase
VTKGLMCSFCTIQVHVHTVMVIFHSVVIFGITCKSQNRFFQKSAHDTAFSRGNVNMFVLQVCCIICVRFDRKKLQKKFIFKPKDGTVLRHEVLHPQQKSIDKNTFGIHFHQSNNLTEFMQFLLSLFNFQSIAAIFCILIGLSLIYYNFASKKPKLIHKNEQITHSVLSQMKKVHQVYYPTFWMMNAHLNTILSDIIRDRYAPIVIYDRELVVAEDGGTLALDWIHHDKTLDASTPVVFIYPGVTGHSQGSYVREIATYLTTKGYRVVSLNQRGINCELTSPKISCAAFTGDIELIIDHLVSKYPQAPVYGVSYSMGANILLKHLGKSKSTKLAGVVSVSNPLDFTKSAALFSHFVAKTLYSEHLCRGALAMIK